MHTYTINVGVATRRMRRTFVRHVPAFTLTAESTFNAAELARQMFAREPGVLDLHIAVTSADSRTETFGGVRATFPMDI